MCALMLATRKIQLEILNFDHKRHVEGENISKFKQHFFTRSTFTLASQLPFRHFKAYL